MTLTQCIERLKKYQKWRRGADIKQPNPKEIGETLDTVIKYLEIQKNTSNSKIDNYKIGICQDFLLYLHDNSMLNHFVEIDVNLIVKKYVDKVGKG
jgi:hypothetical protein